MPRTLVIGEALSKVYLFGRGRLDVWRRRKGQDVMFDDLFSPLAFARGAPMKNRFHLAPLTNKQSHADGRLSEAEIDWLVMRAEGGFSFVMTAAAHVQASGQGFPGQLGIFGDEHLPGLKRLADRLRAAGALCAVQLYHAGARADRALAGDLVSASDDPASGARELSLGEVERLRDDFVRAALRAERAGFDGVELHGAHGYLITQFLSPETNRRQDRYGGSLENRSRLLFEIIEGVRAGCGRDFQLGLRLSPERYGVKLAEIRETAAEILRQGQVDYLDLSLWDAFKLPVEEAFQSRALLSWFTDLERGRARLGAAGAVMTPAQCLAVLEAGCDFVTLGRAAILQKDYPHRLRRNPAFAPVSPPVTQEHLATQGVSPPFLEYLRSFKHFVMEP
jgi:2,4-dienoyl-CoA reductase-like NADH-dependent reductase (Old Yellow Enzyme family)